MTKKDYQLIAHLLGEVLAETHTEKQRKFVFSLINRLAIRLKDQNILFDERNFFNYIKKVSSIIVLRDEK